MTVKDDLVTSIEAELAVLKSIPEEKPVVVAEPAPTVKHANPIIQMAIDQAAERLTRETAK
jgi:hypothetical protein